MDLKDKVILVTGGASGIGEGCVRVFVEAGAKVVISDRNAARGQSVLESITATGGTAAFIATDVTDEAAIKAMVDFAVDRFGGLDGAVNAAGIAGDAATTADHTAAEWRRNFEVMLLGVAMSMKYEIPALLKRGGGSIINIASTGGLGGVPMMGPYSAAKYGVIGATKSAALEYAQAGIRVNAICPGLFDTPLFRSKAAEGMDYSGVVKMVPMGRFGQPSEIGDTALWLLSSRSSYVTGQAIVVDGGLITGTWSNPE